MCVIKEDTVESLSKEPVLECTHRNIEKCHYTYITQFSPSQEEECEENFEKSCQITFRKEAVRNTVRKCYRPQVKVCNGQGEEQCRTVYETDCTTTVCKNGIFANENFLLTLSFSIARVTDPPENLLGTQNVRSFQWRSVAEAVWWSRGTRSVTTNR